MTHTGNIGLAFMFIPRFKAIYDCTEEIFIESTVLDVLQKAIEHVQNNAKGFVALEGSKKVYRTVTVRKDPVAPRRISLMSSRQGGNKGGDPSSPHSPKLTTEAGSSISGNNIQMDIHAHTQTSSSIKKRRKKSSLGSFRSMRSRRFTATATSDLAREKDMLHNRHLRHPTNLQLQGLPSYADLKKAAQMDKDSIRASLGYFGDDGTSIDFGGGGESIRHSMGDDGFSNGEEEREVVEEMPLGARVRPSRVVKLGSTSPVSVERERAVAQVQGDLGTVE